MSGQRDVDGLLRAWLDASAPAGQPGGLLHSTLARTVRSRPRPAWLAGLIGEALPRPRQPERRAMFVFALAAALVAIAAVVGLQLVNRWNVGSEPTPEPSYGPLNWSGPVRTPRGELVVHELVPSGQTWPDPRDAAESWGDITAVDASGEGQDYWRLDLGAVPPKAADLDPSETVIAYGLVFETTGDDAPDYVVGISNEAPEAGDFHVWVTNLATGHTEEQTGPPYGYPVEFRHPDEGGPVGLDPATMTFTFLGGRSRDGLDVSARFYAWASVTQAGEVVAWDYAPDVSWLTLGQE